MNLIGTCRSLFALGMTSAVGMTGTFDMTTLAHPQDAVRVKAAAPAHPTGDHRSRYRPGGICR
jgi:hypothetical protein